MGVDVSKTSTCSSPYIRDPFPANVVPLNRISPIGVKLLSYYPTPNTAGLTQNYVFSGNTGKYSYNQPMVRWDHALTDKDRVYTLITFQHGSEYRNQTGIPGDAASGNIWSQRTDFNVIADWTRILSPTAIFDLRASFGRFTQYFPDTDLNSSLTAKDLGITLPRAPTSTSTVPPRVTLDQFSDLFANGTNLYTWSTNNQWNVVPTLTFARGTKTLKVGIDMVYAGIGTGNIGQSNGQFSFNRYATQHYPLRAGGSTDGAGIADLLLGNPGSGFIDWNDTYYRTWPYFGAFLCRACHRCSTLSASAGRRTASRAASTVQTAAMRRGAALPIVHRSRRLTQRRTATSAENPATRKTPSPHPTRNALRSAAWLPAAPTRPILSATTRKSAP